MCGKHQRHRADQFGNDRPTERRAVLRGLGGLPAIGAATPGGARLAFADGPVQLADVAPEDALTRLMEGNARYVSGDTQPRDFAADRDKLARGQAPFAAILSCADSRVAPELAFDQSRGDLFVVRLAGNFVNDDGLASLEFAVHPDLLGTRLIMVLGHSGCGAVDAAIKVVKEGAELPGHLPTLVRSIEPAVAVAEKRGGDLFDAAVRANVELNVERLKTAEPVVAELVRGGRVKVVGAVYDLATGRVARVT